VARWLFFTNHMHVLTALAEQPDLRVREVAREVGITERATHRIITELVNDGYLTRTRVGSRNRYEINTDAALRHPLHAKYNAGQVIRLLTTAGQADEDGDRLADGGQRIAPGGPDTFREVFAAAPAGIVVGDVSGRFLAVNPSYCALLGYSEDELLGHSFREFTHPDDLPAGDQALAELVAGKRSEYEREKRYIRKDGTTIWARLRIAVTDDPENGHPLFVAHVLDISERKRHDRVLAEAEERFRSAFDNAPIGMALVALDGRWLKVNRSVCEITGYSETALLTRTFQDITHPDDLDTDLAYIEDVLAGRQRTFQMEKRYFHADGHLIWVMLSVSLVRDDSGTPLYFISQIEDITERKQREQALQNQAAQLAVIAAARPLAQLSTASRATS
jgi:PAS domain S-box-containing protein